ncbi:sulfite exporter TauE/SafE family protein [Kocuria carniphila]|uniref:Probable membrane transporter protein n=2 Tax=Kocuria TaxID=57493 RepID=A0ABV3V497_9MICC|nr:sulfite exporter TauE/SafE family protein [Kocuria sp.]MDO5368584.1 sulfite exporter TauE/SafE family protein [Kocuria sp.]
MLILTAALIAVLVGSILQRVSGTGVGLVVAPVLSLLMGPATGVLVTNAATVCSGFMITLAVRRMVEWKHAAVLILSAIPGVVLGALVVRWVPAEWLQIGVGAVVLLALAITKFTHTAGQVNQQKAVVPAGLIGGFFNSTAGVAAPAMVVYSRITNWDQLRFAATMQPVFMSLGALSVGSKLIAGVHFALPVPVFVAFGSLIVTIFVGITVGTWLSRRLDKAAAANLAMGLAAVGGVVVMVRGALGLWLG